MTEEQFKKNMDEYQVIANKLIRILKGIPKIDVNDEKSLDALNEFTKELKSLTSKFVKSVKEFREQNKELIKEISK